MAKFKAVSQHHRNFTISRLSDLCLTALPTAFSLCQQQQCQSSSTCFSSFLFPSTPLSRILFCYRGCKELSSYWVNTLGKEGKTVKLTDLPSRRYKLRCFSQFFCLVRKPYPGKCRATERVLFVHEHLLIHLSGTTASNKTQKELLH